MMRRCACGLDVGGSAIKGGVVDLETGKLVGEAVRVVTPEPATPEAVLGACREALELLEAPEGMAVGISFPAPILDGPIPFMANLDQSWVGVDIVRLMREGLGHPVAVLNDADAAGLAEVALGAARGVSGTVIVTTLGTGIGSALFIDGKLVPNVELGHLEIDGFDAESKASAHQKTVEDLSWQEWAARLQRYYSHVVKLFSPRLIVVGGAVSKDADDFIPLLNLRCRIIPAALRNQAGIVGAAAAAGEEAVTEPETVSV